jgi:hypothetical protein
MTNLAATTGSDLAIRAWQIAGNAGGCDDGVNLRINKIRALDVALIIQLEVTAPS